MSAILRLHDEQLTFRLFPSLFMVPGMAHCLGESYATVPTVDLDVGGALKQWSLTPRAPSG